MADNPQPMTRLAIILGVIVLAALLMFVITGGGPGMQKVESDADLPKVTSPTPPSESETTGRR